MNNTILVLWGGGDSSCVFVYSRTKISVFYKCTFIYLSGFHCGIIQESVDHIWVLHHFQSKKKTRKKQKKNIYYVKCSKKKKKVFCRPVAIVKIEGLLLSQIWAAEREARHETEPGLCGSFIGAYLLVCYSFCSVTLVDSCPFVFAERPLTVYIIVFILFPEMKHKTKSNNGIVLKVKKKEDRCFH